MASLKSDSKSKDTKDLLSSHKVKPLKSLIHDLRVLKSSDEVDLMRRIGKATGRSFQDAMRQGPWETERELAAFLHWRHVVNGCDGSAYVPIVAGGKNALVKHYTRNDDVFRADELAFVDAGGVRSTETQLRKPTDNRLGDWSLCHRHHPNVAIGRQILCSSKRPLQRCFVCTT